jgi:hypothetical protein
MDTTPARAISKPQVIQLRPETRLNPPVSNNDEPPATAFPVLTPAAQAPAQVPAPPQQDSAVVVPGATPNGEVQPPNLETPPDAIPGRPAR